MKSLHFIAPIDATRLIGQVVSLVNPLGKREDHIIAEIAYSKLEDLFQGRTIGNVVFSLSREKAMILANKKEQGF